MRLVGGATEYEGRLEVYRLGTWGTVCETNMDNKMALTMAAVVCRSLGFPWYNKRNNYRFYKSINQLQLFLTNILFNIPLHDNSKADYLKQI